MVRRLSAVDAQMYWMSAKIPNDQFLLYGFAGVPSDLEQRAGCGPPAGMGDCPELGLRIEERNALTYPAWVTAPIEPEQFVVHDLADSSWAGCLAAVAGLAEYQLDARRTAWRLHVFAPVDGVPGPVCGTVAVLQATHVLGDGIRSSALAAWLFGRADEVPPVPAPPPFRRRGTAVAQLPGGPRASTIGARHRCGTGSPAGGLAPCAAQQRTPCGVRSIRTVIRNRARAARAHCDRRRVGRGVDGSGGPSARAW